MDVYHCIFFQLSKSSQIGMKFLSQKVAELDVTPVQATVLGLLCEEDRITSGELGKRIELDSATVTGILDRLAAAGLVERKGNPGDRRAIHIHLTPNGKKKGEDAIAAILDANRQFLHAFSLPEKRDLMHLLRKVRSENGKERVKKDSAKSE